MPTRASAGCDVRGLLREEVVVSHTDEAVRVFHALWEVSLPRAWVDAHPAVADVLARRQARQHVQGERDVQAVLALLEAQGCFHLAEPKPSYSLREARDVFDAFKSRWYAEYYAHPLWDRLRTGQATRNELVAWTIHNYHISRAAGIVGARLAGTIRDASWRRFFTRDTLDEYWHCDEYYFVRHPSLTLGIEDVKRYIPLPGSLAFEVHTLQTAERSPLAHLLVAYFQESSVMFERDCRRFYRQVESAYGLPGFFDGWERHIRIDLEHGHADGLASLFDTPLQVTREELLGAIRDAWLASFFLLRSLDDVEGEGVPDGRIRLRLPDDAAGGSDEVAPRLGANRTTFADRDRMASALARAAFRCLGYARAHDDIIAAGGLCDALSGATGRHGEALALAAADGADEGDPPHYDSPWAAACACHLAESAVGVPEFLTVARVASTVLAAAGSANMSEAASAARAGLSRCETSDGRDPTRLVTHARQTAELFERWWSSADRVPERAFAL